MSDIDLDAMVRLGRSLKDDLDKALARVAELEAERDGDPIRRLNEVIKDATVQIRNAEARGYDRAVANLRDSQQRARYGADRAIMRIAADYLVATKESTDGV